MRTIPHEGKRIVASIECRMTSSRLPGKVLMPACGKPMLELMLERVRQAPQIDEVVFATTTNLTDQPIVDLARRLGVSCHRGSEEDVLSRVLGAARQCKADIIVELTGDCPLTDPEIVGQGIDTYLMNECDYLSNVHVPGFPIGIDVQVFSADLLAIADREGMLPEDREHVSWFFRRQPERFRTIHLAPPLGLYRPELRITLDEESDYLMLKRIFEDMYPGGRPFGWREILDYLDAHPEVAQMNAQVKQKEVVSSS